MATVRFELRGGSSALQMIYLIVSHSHRRDRISTGIKIDPKKWNFKAKKVKKGSDSIEINQKLSEIKFFVERLIFQTKLNNPPLTFKKIKPELDAKFRPSNEVEETIIENEAIPEKSLPKAGKIKYNPKTVLPTNLLTFAASHIEKIKKEVSVTGKKLSESTLKNYTTTYNHLKKFCKHKRISSDFNDIDVAFITAYRTYLTIDVKMKMNTVARHIKMLKTLLNEATEQGINQNTSYKTYKSMKMVTEDTDNVYLTEEEIARIYALDLSEDWRMQNVRDWFVIACEMGLRYSDWSKIDLSKIENNRIEIIQKKTGDRAIIPLNITKYFWQIVKRRNNILPRVYTNQECNRTVKTIAKLANINEMQTVSYTKAGKQNTEYLEKYSMVSTHTARRTFATNMFLKNMPISLIMSITGHKTEKAFLLYVKAGIKEKADMLEKYINSQK